MGDAKCQRTGKVRHPNKREAEEALSRSKLRADLGGQREGAPTRTYRCGYCNGWHLTSNPHRF